MFKAQLTKPMLILFLACLLILSSLVGLLAFHINRLEPSYSYQDNVYDLLDNRVDVLIQDADYQELVLHPEDLHLDQVSLYV